MSPDNPFNERASHYRQFFQEALEPLPLSFSATFCVCMNDVMPIPFDVPVMAFQRTLAQPLILVPDPDFFKYHWFEDVSFSDPFSYTSKQPSAIFCGSTSGRVFNREDIERQALERLAAAEYFSRSSVVDFRLPHIVQADKDAEEVLRAKPYCQAPMLPWNDQYRYRFLFSIDGNGATCSRVWLALRSQSVLLKMRSENLLYYFHGLQPWLHHIPIEEFSDVESWIDLELQQPGCFADIAEAGQTYIRKLVTRAQVTRYMTVLLQEYAKCFDEQITISENSYLGAPES